MSNEFILIVTWKPLNQTIGDTTSESKIARLLSSASVSDRELVTKLPHVTPIICMDVMPGMKRRYLLGFDKHLAEYEDGDGIVQKIRPCIYSPRSVKYYDCYVVVLNASESGVVLLDSSGKEVWSLNGYSIMCTMGAHEMNHCQNVEIVNGKLYYVQTDKSIVKLNLCKVAADLKSTGKSIEKPTTFNKNIFELCWNSQTKKLYSVTFDMKVYASSGLLIDAKAMAGELGNQVNRDIATHGKYIVLACSSLSYHNTVLLYDTRGRHMDKSHTESATINQDSNDTVKHMSMFTTAGLTFTILSRKVSRLELYLVHRSRLHHVPVNLSSVWVTGDRKSIYGYLVDTRNAARAKQIRIDLIVYGFETLKCLTVMMMS